MTDKEIKTNILAEIERLNNNLWLDDRHDQGVSDGLHAISKFINSLPEEPEFTIDKDVSQMADDFAGREYELDGYERKWLSKGYYHGYMDANKSKPEEPVSEDICNQCEAHNDKDKCDELVFGHNCPIVTTSEDLEEASEEYTSKVLERTNVLIGNQPVGEEIEAAFRAGAEWQKENLWKPADGDNLPEIDREVIALLDNGKVVFAHRPPEYWDGKNIVTGKVTRNYPKTYGKGGWNIPDIAYWLDVNLPKEIEL